MSEEGVRAEQTQGRIGKGNDERGRSWQGSLQNVYSEGIAFHIAFSVIFLITPCNRGSMSQGNPGDGTLNLYLCTGCNSSMCLFCGSLHLLRGAYINQIQKIFFWGVLLLIKNKGFLLRSLIARLRARRVKIYILKPLIFFTKW